MQRGHGDISPRRFCGFWLAAAHHGRGKNNVHRYGRRAERARPRPADAASFRISAGDLRINSFAHPRIERTIKYLADTLVGGEIFSLMVIDYA